MSAVLVQAKAKVVRYSRDTWAALLLPEEYLALVKAKAVEPAKLAVKAEELKAAGDVLPRWYFFSTVQL